VLLNLLSNAVKYNHEGGIVSVRLDDAPGGRLCLLVRDTGPGVTPDDLARLFQPFERLDAEERGIEGTGMGLALVKGLVEAMGGTVAAESVVGEGTTFRLELAAASSPLATVAAAPGEAAAPEATGDVRRRVLYIEDNVSNVKLMEQLFADRADHELLVAMHGQLGLDLARQHRPDAILLDLHLPDMDGAEVLARLRRDPATREIPVMILSADAGAGRVSRLLEAGASAYLTKPLDLKRLIQELDALGAPAFVATVEEVASPRVSIRGERM